MTKKIILHVLHGFLGLPSDWNFLKEKYTVVAHDLYKNINELEQWASVFTRQISPSENNVLIGYSLGGRLALHALAYQPNLWKQAIFISTHPGLQEGKEERKKQDESWAFKFLNEPWEKLMKEWDNQEVFCGIDSPFFRHEKSFHRENLSQLLTQYSVSKQQDFREKMATFSQPILWIAGEKDIRYKSLALAQSFQNPQSKVWIAPQAGHRVPWEQPESFCRNLHTFLT